MTRPANQLATDVPIGDGLHVTAARDSRQAFSRDEYEARVLGVQADMADSGLDVLLVHTPENICYLTGYETSGYFEYQVLAVPASGAPCLLVRNIERFNVDVYTWLPDAFIWSDGVDYIDATVRLVESLGVPGRARVGLEYHSWFVPARVSAALTAGLRNHLVIDAGRLIERRRLVKSPAEQAYSRAAAGIADRTLSAAVEAAAAGKSELDVAAAAHFGNIVAGGEYPALPHYVSSGERRKLGHPNWTEKPLAEGDLMRLEFLGVKRRYHAGLIRTVHIGRAPAQLRQSAALALELQDEVLGELRPGVSTGEITRSARERLATLGHSLAKRRIGYSIGIGFPPIAGESQTADFREGSPWVLQPGMVFHMLSVISDVGFSETVLITEGGYERLTQTPRALIEV